MAREDTGLPEDLLGQVQASAAEHGHSAHEETIRLLTRALKPRPPRRTVSQGWVPRTHGIPSSYIRGCRCGPCTQANTDRGRRGGHQLNAYHRNKQERVEVNGRMVHPDCPHGTRYGYVGYACRCQPCTQASSDYVRDR